MSANKSLAAGILALAFFFLIGYATASANATDAQISACRDRVVQQYPGTPASAVGITYIWESNGSVRLDWSTGGSRSGLCVIGSRNEVYQFIDNANVTPSQQGSGNPENFGYVQDIGQFAVVVGSGSYHNGQVDFDAIVNGRRERWGAVCATGRIGTGGNYEPYTTQTQNITSFVCGSGNNESRRDFGNVPGIGNFQVVAGSGYYHGGQVDFDAYVNSAKQRWGADCAAGRIGTGGTFASYSAQTRQITDFVCGGPQNGNIRDFGNVAGIGQFQVVVGSGYYHNGQVDFDAIVNSAKQRWGADCAAGRIGTGGNFAPYSGQTREVADFVCGGGPQPNGSMRDFGYVRDVGQFQVVVGSAKYHDGQVDFDAIVNGNLQRWGAVCATGRLGTGGTYLADSMHAREITNFVCGYSSVPAGGGQNTY